jgi:hypothetical protein
MTVGYELDDGSWIFKIGVEKIFPLPLSRRFHTDCSVYQTLYAGCTRTDSSAEGEGCRP